MSFTEQFQDIDPEIHGIRLPQFQLNTEDYRKLDIPHGLSSLELFRLLVGRGFQKRIQDKDIDLSQLDAYQKRLDYEMSVIEPTDFVDYLLMVWDVVNIAHSNNIATGPGRGSAASSLVLYCLKITDIDPVVHELYFERFLSESRVTPNIVNGVKYYSDAADIDLDIEDSQREKLILLLKEKYKGHFCKISTVGTLQSRKLIKEVCKIVLGYSEQQSLEVSALIPSLFSRIYSLKQSKKEVAEFAKFTEKNPQAYKIALKLSELPFSKGSHASAYIVSYEPLLDSIPCESGEGEMVTSYDMDYAMQYNIKLDLLGLKAVGIINEVCKNLKLNPHDFKLDYDNVYQYLQEVKSPYGLFQISGDCNLGVVNKVKPRNIDHLAAVTALARPGALQFTNQYAEFVNEGKSGSVHPFFDDVLSSTGFLALYQEQAMKMVEKIGMKKTDSEAVRKVIGKKLLKEVGKWKDKIFDKAKENNLDPKIPTVLWKILEDSASYSFNRCLDAQTKVLTENGQKNISEIKIGDKVLAFDVNNSQNHFVNVVNTYISKTELFEFTFSDGTVITCSLRHKFLTEKGMKTIKEINDLHYGVKTAQDIFLKIVSYKNVGVKVSYDLEVDHENHNFYANSLVTSNSHSYSYGTVAAQTVYLKFKYPQYFFLACLRQAASRGDFLEHFEQIQHELPHFGIKLLPPNISKSGLDFAIDGKDIRFGIGEIKGVSEKSIDKLKQFAANVEGSDLKIFNAAKEAKLSIGILSALIQSGTLGHGVAERSRKVLEAQIWNVLTPKEKLFCLNNESKYNNDLIALLKDYLNWTDANGKKFTKQSRLDTIRKHCAGYFQIYNLNHKNELLASYFYEKKLLGFSYSTTLKMIFGDTNEDVRNIKEINDFVPVKGYYELVATVKEVNSGTSKSGNPYLKLRLSDETGETFAMLLGDKLARYLDQLEPPKEDDILYLVGSKGDSILWINRMEVQNVKVYTKLSELKNIDFGENKSQQND